jgi:hypothetical protein
VRQTNSPRTSHQRLCFCGGGEKFSPVSAVLFLSQPFARPAKIVLPFETGPSTFGRRFVDRRCHFHCINKRKIMKKLKLDALEVDSFHTSWLDNWEGTVGGQERISGEGATHCGGIQTCAGDCVISADGMTQCGGDDTCGDGCQVSAGAATQCGQTCGADCTG